MSCLTATPRALKNGLSRSKSICRDCAHTKGDAIQAIEESLLEGRRKMLVAMTTGTGKTLTTIGLLYRLLKSGYARRVLFLVDRRALAAQAASEMAIFEPEPGLKFDRIYEVYSHRFQREDFDEKLGFDPKLFPTEYLTNPRPGI